MAKVWRSEVSFVEMILLLLCVFWRAVSSDHTVKQEPFYYN